MGKRLLIALDCGHRGPERGTRRCLSPHHVRFDAGFVPKFTHCRQITNGGGNSRQSLMVESAGLPAVRNRVFGGPDLVRCQFL